MKTLSRKKLAASLAVLFLFNFSACGPGRDDSRKALIKVNDRVITSGEYRAALKRLVPSGQGSSWEGLSELKKELVNEMVEEELLLEEARRARLSVAEKELSSEVDLIRKEYGDESFKAVIEERYDSFAVWEERIKRKLLVKKAIERLTASVKVTDAEARAWYAANTQEFSRPEQARARMIVVASEEEALRVRAGLTPKNFGDVARELSLSPEGAKGGDLGYFSRGDMPAEFEEAVFSLKRPGEISPVVKTAYGFHIFLLEDRRQKGKAAYPEVKGRIMERLRAGKSVQLLGEWMDMRKRSSKIEVREELL
jgi:peptidyl-prolyl cis-trans isomerase C